MLPVAHDLRMLVLPAEEVFNLPAVLRVVEEVADCRGMPHLGEFRLQTGELPLGV